MQRSVHCSSGCTVFMGSADALWGKSFLEIKIFQKAAADNLAKVLMQRVVKKTRT